MQCKARDERAMATFIAGIGKAGADNLRSHDRGSQQRVSRAHAGVYDRDRRGGCQRRENGWDAVRTGIPDLGLC